MKNLGIIEPSGSGRWMWPFREMEVGDFFRVDPQRRRMEEVRNLVYSSGNRIGYKFSVTTDETGMTRVERVDRDARAQERFATVVAYDIMRRRLMSGYGLGEREVDGLNWFLEIGESVSYHARCVKVEGLRDLVVDTAGHNFHVELRADGITLTRLEDGATLQDVLREREEKLLLELMG